MTLTPSPSDDSTLSRKLKLITRCELFNGLPDAELGDLARCPETFFIRPGLFVNQKFIGERTEPDRREMLAALADGS